MVQKKRPKYSFKRVSDRKKIDERVEQQKLQLEEQLHEQKLILKALNESKKKYEDLVENANDIIFTTDIKGNFLSLNHAGVKTYGYSSQESLKMNIDQILHPNYQVRYVSHINKLLNGINFKSTPYEVLTVTRDSRKIWVEINIRLLKDNEHPCGFQGIARDITERRQIIDALKKAEEEKNLILSAISEIVVFHDMDMRIRWANSMASATHQMPISSMIGHHCYEIWQNIDSPCPECPVTKTLKTGEKGNDQISTPDGQIWQIKSFPVTDDEKMIGVVQIAKDITDRERMEKEMARFDRMNLIGEMAASFGHEIRNPMATVKGFLQMLYPKKEFISYQSYFDLMIEEMDRANAIITEFLSLAKDKAVKLSSHNLNEIVENLYPLLLADALHADKSIEMVLEDIPMVYIDKNEIHQMILNLVRNGLEAMEAGGILTIRTYADEQAVILAVQDQGKGIDPSILPKLGIPFTTTKEDGTGIGLAICYSIAERHHAQIDIATSCNGTTFFVRFRNLEYCQITNEIASF